MWRGITVLDFLKLLSVFYNGAAETYILSLTGSAKTYLEI